uniref:Uncharacterized protein LOC111114513 isoform X2 n=1 Tax=Crassostrea virginica TaxID=6565 RepID=A0A8B8BYT3_CRAVI|nr:uncharacterized protein LOC111114513 isoform X2 [Crassostrea virginica]
MKDLNPFALTIILLLWVPVVQSGSSCHNTYESGTGTVKSYCHYYTSEDSSSTDWNILGTLIGLMCSVIAGVVIFFITKKCRKNENKVGSSSSSGA